MTKGYFANANMGLDQVEGVAVPNFPRMWASFAEGSADVAIVVVGAANSREYDASFGIRYLSFDDSPEALARMRVHVCPRRICKKCLQAACRAWTGLQT